MSDSCSKCGMSRATHNKLHPFHSVASKMSSSFEAWSDVYREFYGMSFHSASLAAEKVCQEVVGLRAEVTALIEENEMVITRLVQAESGLLYQQKEIMRLHHERKVAFDTKSLFAQPPQGPPVTYHREDGNAGGAASGGR